MTKRIEIAQAPAPLETYAQHFDPLFGKSNQRGSFRHYLEGLLLPSEREFDPDGLGQHRTPGRSAATASTKTAMVSLRVELG